MTPRLLPWRRPAILSLAVALFVVVGALRFASDDPSGAISSFYLLPIALLGLEFGWRGAAVGVVSAIVLLVSWVVVDQVDLSVFEVVLRCVLLTLLGAFFGGLGDRLFHAIADRAVIADQILYMEGLTPHGLVRLDGAGVIIGFNEGARTMLGYSEAEAASQPLEMIFRGQGATGTPPHEMFEGALREGIWDEERWIVGKHGDRRWVAVRVTPLGAGRSTGCAMVLRDLTATKEARHESSRMWEVSRELLATVRPDGHFQQVNPRWEEVLGWTAAELHDRPSVDFVHPDDQERSAAEASLLGQGGHETVSFENRYRCRDGSYRWLRWNAMASPEDNLIYAAASDITELRLEKAALEASDVRLRSLSQELEVRVEERTRELADANKELVAFSYSVSHDLRAPLRAIDGYSQAVLEDCASVLPEEGKADLERVRGATTRMSTMIDDMLALSRVTQKELRSEPVDLSALAGEICDELRLLERDRDVQLEVAQGQNVTGDPVLLRLMLHNLFENAWKFTEHSENAHIELTCVGTERGRSTFAVRDNGAGFDMRYVDKLFRPFERLHRQEDYSGTGVGLTTVSRILNRHGGKIWAEGTPDKGAVFFFDLANGKVP
jgi:PAS domain S-box-containing protein